MKPDIDTTKPIQVAYKGIGQWFDFCLIHLGRKHAYGFTTKDMDKPDACEWDFQEWNFRNKPEEPSEPTDTLKAQPEIDWDGTLQVSEINEDDWRDVVVVGEAPGGYIIGWLSNLGPLKVSAWALDAFKFRNKPAEPKRVRGFVNIYPSILYEDKEYADRVASPNRIACVEINVPEGHGPGR